MVKIPVQIDTHNGYFDILKLLSPIPPFNNLRNREMEVLAELMYWYNHYEGLEIDVRNIMTFEYSTRQHIMSKLNMAVDVLNNNLTSLRKKGFISGKKILQTLPNLSKIDKLELQFNFTIKK
jgi:hypothetical protein